MTARVSVDGLQIRPERPSRPQPAQARHRIGVVFTAGLAFLVVVAVQYLLDPRTLPIRHVQMNGEFRHLSPPVLQEIAEHVVRGGFFNVNVEVIRGALLDEPWVRHVTVRRVWPDSLSVYVQEQIPVARWGERALLNDQGELFAPAVDAFPEGLPILRGPNGTHAEMLARFRFIEHALAQHRQRAAMMTLSDRRAWSFVLAQGTTVILGRRDFLGRFERFTAIIPDFLVGSLDRIDAVDMRYTNGFAVRWKAPVSEGSTTGWNANGQEKS